jgi:large conductance mechanosensitive channel
MSLLQEFKTFAMKGNVIDLAVGVIIGAAFGKIVDSLVKQILMPLVGLLLPGEQGYLGWKIAVGAKEVPYGLFLGELVNFVIVAFALYVFIVKFLGFVMKAKEAPPTAPSRQEALLTEIRDLLKAR